MTSINAMRFDFYSGAMVCDEQRHWNPERFKVYAADKIRAVVPVELRSRYSLAAAYGNTGTSTIGDELRLTIYREVEDRYLNQCNQLGHAPETFLSVGDVAGAAWDTICRLKHAHVDDALKTRYGFTSADLIAGQYDHEGRNYKIQNDQIIRDALDAIAPDPGKQIPDAVFGNAGIIAGCDAEKGFQIFNISMSLGFIEPVESGYIALGSGGDSTNFIIPRFLNRAGVAGRLEGIDRTEGIYALLDAVNMASEHNLGVGGYFNIILFDLRASQSDRVYREINDHRSKLASESVKACRAGLLDYEKCCRMLDGLIFSETSADEAEEFLWRETSDKKTLHRLLRGYPVS